MLDSGSLATRLYCLVIATWRCSHSWPLCIHKYTLKYKECSPKTECCPGGFEQNVLDICLKKSSGRATLHSRQHVYREVSWVGGSPRKIWRVNRNQPRQHRTLRRRPDTLPLSWVHHDSKIVGVTHDSRPKVEMAVDFPAQPTDRQHSNEDRKADRHNEENGKTQVRVSDYIRHSQCTRNYCQFPLPHCPPPTRSSPATP